jgi:DNA-binding response OmpR family regulator
VSEGGVVLVVDDVMVRDVVGRYLGRAGYHVTVAGDGEEALFAALTAPPDL